MGRHRAAATWTPARPTSGTPGSYRAPPLAAPRPPGGRDLSHFPFCPALTDGGLEQTFPGDPLLFCVFQESHARAGGSPSSSSPRRAHHSAVGRRPRRPLSPPRGRRGPSGSCRAGGLTVQLVLREAGPAQVPHGVQGYGVGVGWRGPEGDSRQRRLVHTPPEPHRPR